MNDRTNTAQTLPCGCRFSNIDDVFVFEPCALDCEWYAYVVAESARQGKPLTTLDAR